jgi:hypothetical protein
MNSAGKRYRIMIIVDVVVVGSARHVLMMTMGSRVELRVA